VATTPELIALGLLAERDWSAYELASHALSRSNFSGAFWPVSERTWYRLPRRLVEDGLAEADEPADGGPVRYSITEAGRGLLDSLDPSGIDVSFLTFRSEGLAVLYATAHGSVEQTTALLRAIRDGLVEFSRIGARTYRERADSGAVLPGRAHVAALIGVYMSETAVNAYHWADDALRRLEALGPDGDREAFARAIWAGLADRLDGFLAALDDVTVGRRDGNPLP
jgi:DNA-binding PadR family transcriptional regulator